MAYTIKGLAKVNECETYDANGLAEMWDYLYICNCGGRKSILNDYKLLRKADRKEMLIFLRENGYANVREYIIQYSTV